MQVEQPKEASSSNGVKKKFSIDFYKGKSPASVFLHEQANIVARY